MAMHSFAELSSIFNEKFETKHFPDTPENLYGSGAYFLTLPAKRIRPVMCLMANELFDNIHPDSYHLATAIELFHNFTLIHDDIMDKAPLRRGMQTVHSVYGEATALLSGDVMLVVAYEYLNRINIHVLRDIMQIFSTTAKQVCEGQQLDMDFEKLPTVSLERYIHMIELKTSVLLAASLQMGSIMGGASRGNRGHMYEFGRNLGIAFQVQDDYLDAFGDPEKFGKQVGGDILANKKTFLMIRAMETANPQQAERLKSLVNETGEIKITETLRIFSECGVDDWARKLKDKYLNEAFRHLEEIAVTATRKAPLEELAHFLVQRDY